MWEELVTTNLGHACVAAYPQVATLHKRNGKGMWVLKKEFWSQEGGGVT
jgi:hypothetical protein